MRREVTAIDHVLVQQHQTSAAGVEVDTFGFDLSLITAKSIKDLRAITYPSNIIGPNPAMNEHAPPGKFFYDRDFLLQFNTICKGEVLAEIALVLLGIDSRHPRRVEPVVQGGYQRGRPRGLARGRGVHINTASGAMGYTRGRESSDGGIGGLDRLGFVSSVRPARSSVGPGQAFGARGDVISGLHGRRRTTEHRQSLAAIQPDRIATAPPASVSRFIAEGKNRLADKSDETTMESVERQVRALLGALTAENFDSVSSQILEWANKSATESDGRTLRLVIKLVFEKAKDQAVCAPICAKLCRRLWQDISPDVQDNQRTDADGNLLGSGLLLREYLLERYGEELEATWSRGASSLETVEKPPLKPIARDAGVDASQDARKSTVSGGYNAVRTAKRQALGLIQFIGELFVLEMVSTEVIHACITKLLFNITAPKDHDVESLCLLLTIVGAKLEIQPKMGQQVRLYIQRMHRLMNNECLTFETSRLINVRSVVCASVSP
ncbi:hypothetical protein QFC22_003195 [Naganishia vaughanmartiniae]|uniref:Uncharacterized protein n=1 Tax=Naganishia vaughanmartiniae TaxID=1424756 RepID=A0ACC2X8C0_9TREE|nr:hypothetical protein QFC22_003195 [Naganishia vaughanmartiniae]